MTTDCTRVLWLTKGLGRGGAEQLLVSLAGELVHAPLRLDAAYVLPHKSALVGDLEALGVRVHPLGDGWWPGRLRALLKQERYDVVHTHSPVVAAAARLLAPSTTKMVHTEHNMWERYRLATRALNALTLHRNAVVWAVSEGVAGSIRPVLPGRRPDVRVLVHGLPERRDPVGLEARQRGLSRLGLDEGPFTIGTVGNLTPKKDHESLIRALGLVRAYVPDARLVVVGGGPLHAHLEKVTVEEGLAHAVTLTGVRNDVDELLPAFDVFAMSSLFEGLSIALLEAMASGVPPVVTAVGGLPEVVGRGVQGLVVPPADPVAMAQALETLARDSALRTRLGLAARDRAAAFGIGPAAATLAATYAELARDRREVLQP